MENTCGCVLGPWPRAFLSLASRVSVLGKAVLGLGLGLGFFLCPWPWPRALCPRLHLWQLQQISLCLEVVALRNLRKALSTTKLPPKIQFSSKFCVKYININVLSQLNVTTSLKCKYEKCCFFVYWNIIVISHFFCFSESKYVKCLTLNWLNYSKYVSVSLMFHFVLLLLR